MADTKHTPGPWALKQDAMGRVVIASVSAPPRTVGEIGNVYRSNFANARLMVASPEMLSALRAAAELIDYALPKFDWGKSALDGRAIQLLNEVPMTVRAAIAKATGGEP